MKKPRKEVTMLVRVSAPPGMTKAAITREVRTMIRHRSCWSDAGDDVRLKWCRPVTRFIAS